MADLACPFTVLPHGEGLDHPRYETGGAAGMDIPAAVAEDAPLTIAPGERVAVPTGLAFAVPEGHEMQIRPRSGLAAKSGLTVANAPGTVDSDYRGEVMVLLVNLGADPVEVTRGMRVAQMVFAPVSRAALRRVDSLDGTERGAGGFGSTGVRGGKARGHA